MAGISCPFCAYCFDEALVARDVFARVEETQKAEMEADLAATHERTKLEAV